MEDVLNTSPVDDNECACGSSRKNQELVELNPDHFVRCHKDLMKQSKN